MISVETALAHLFGLVVTTETETVTLDQACGRVLAKSVTAHRDQPPFSASAMDGYAVSEKVIIPGLELKVIGESAAGHRFNGALRAGEAVRIFTGAPTPKNTNQVIIQENIKRNGDKIVIQSVESTSSHIRVSGCDFKSTDKMRPPMVLKPSDIALLAAMNAPKLTVRTKPVIALISNGDELVTPGQSPGEDQIIASNTFGLAALIRAYGAVARILPIARDNIKSLQTALHLAEGADLIVTIGGASVGDHDLVAKAATQIGFEQNFYKVAMRPGKPLMAGRLGNAALIGLPGNPVSAMVCGHIFLIPMVQAMLGLEQIQRQRFEAKLAHDLAENGPREHYMRATLHPDGLHIDKRQDSALLTVLSRSNALAVRPPYAPFATSGSFIEYIPI
jgi:molybdopterin molybdotransferase